MQFPFMKTILTHIDFARETVKKSQQYTVQVCKVWCDQ